MSRKGDAIRAYLRKNDGRSREHHMSRREFTFQLEELILRARPNMDVFHEDKRDEFQKLMNRDDGSLFIKCMAIEEILFGKRGDGDVVN